MKRHITNKSQLLITSAMLLFILFSIIFGSIALVSLSRSFSDMDEYITAVDLAREVQTEMEKQFHSWKTTVLEGDEFDSYKNNFHEFSCHSTLIQNKLFNLKLICTTYENLCGDIEALRDNHNTITKNYISHLVELERNGFKNKNEIIRRTHGQDSGILKRLDVIVAEIENTAGEQIITIKTRYARRLFFSMITIFVMSLFMGINIAFRLARIHLELEDRVEERTRELRLAKEETEEAGKIIKISEEKYRLLVEGSEEIIFSLNDDFSFTSANNSIKNHLKIRPENVIGKKFIELVYDEHEGPDASGALVREKLELFNSGDQTVSFNAPLKTELLIEPREFNIRLERINVRGKKEIIGKAIPVSEDSLLQFFESERTIYRIRNSLLTADDMSYRLTRNIHRYADRRDIDSIRVALREIIINSIEHGNLDIRFEEKTTALMTGNYFSFISKRQKEKKYSDRMVTIESSVNEEHAVFLIKDQGNGFDVSAVTAMDVEKTNEEMTSHGRGIIMAMSVFDRVKYNEKGNQVLLMKKLAGSTSS